MKLHWLGLLILGLGQAVLAQTPLADIPARQLFEQKRDFAYTTLYQSAGAKRVEASGNREAQQLLAQARELFAKAKTALGANDLRAADNLLGEALRKMGKAARQVPDATAEQEEKRRQFSKILEEIEGFQSAYESSLQRMGSESTAAALKQIRESVNQAQTLADKGKWDEANELLAGAHGIVVNSMSKLLASKTIIYEMKFDTPKAEFEYELKRNQSYEELVPIALANFHPVEDVVKQVEDLLGKGQQLRASAQRYAADGDYASAFGALQESTGYMQTAVEQAGVTMNQ